MIKPTLELTDIEPIEIELLLEGIYRCYGFDFRKYAHPFIKRRLRHRMRIEKLETISELQEKVLHDPHVMEKLLQDLSINVTEMFRDPGFFHAFRTSVIPKLREYPVIRIWHVGCSTGEEVYSMAIMLHEEGLYERTKIFATDMNYAVLERAKQGVFPLDRMQIYTKNYFGSGGTGAFSEYYNASHGQVSLHPYLKSNLSFAVHNLTTDRSFNEFHVIMCRNVLIYFSKELQNHVHNLLYDSLGMWGFLGLGHRESIAFTSHEHDYTPFHATEKIYRKIQ